MVQLKRYVNISMLALIFFDNELVIGSFNELLDIRDNHLNLCCGVYVFVLA